MFAKDLSNKIFLPPRHEVKINSSSLYLGKEYAKAMVSA
jgi:hypothetical protein